MKISSKTQFTNTLDSVMKQKSNLLVLAIVLLGVGTLFFVDAATPSLSIEAESGIKSGVSTISDSSASGYSAIKFGSGSSTISKRFPGDPNPKLTGKAYWGAAVSGNGDPARHESTAGKSLSIRRTYFGWTGNGRNSLISTAKNDIAANRLPWVSIKTPQSSNRLNSWSDFANGVYDNELDSMLQGLDATGGPVWLTFYHEPEDNTFGGPANEKCEKITVDHPEVDCEGTHADYRAMQKHVRDRMTALGTKNIAFAPILMSWSSHSLSNRDISEWWVPDIWDFMGVDHYRDDYTSGQIYDSQMWINFVEFIESKNLPYAIGEWGVRGTDTLNWSDGIPKIQNFWDWGFNNNKDLLAYAYFDSDLNSPSGGWSLQGDMLIKFQQILGEDDRVQRLSEL